MSVGFIGFLGCFCPGCGRGAGLSLLYSGGLCYLVGLSVGLYLGFDVWFVFPLPGMWAWFVRLVCLLASADFCFGLMLLFLWL